MLTHLTIHNFTLVDHLELELKPGMTVITGETGAGKSILLDALGQTLGDRAEAERVRTGASKADISASFDIRQIPPAREWLASHDLLQEENPQECLLRRVIGADGKSKAYINGQPATLQQLRTLGEILIDIHSQHEHQSLLVKDTHRRLVDEFAGQTELARQVRQAWREWQSRLEHYLHLRDNAAEVSARFQLLSYQANELEQLNLQPGELAKLESEQRSLANAEDILRGSQQLAAFCGDEEQGLSVNLHRALHILRNLPEKSAALSSAEDLLTSAQIQVEEAQHEIERHIDQFNLDPERLVQVEERLSAIYDLARKHRIHAEELPEFIAKLNAELEQLDSGDARLDQLAQQVEQAERSYRQVAEQLSAKRNKAGTSLAKQVNEQLKALAMDNAKFSVSLIPLDKPGAPGLEEVEFLISTNPGQAPRALAKVASGGELSRISLAIQVVTAQTSAIPTLVFDEVDVGIGGATGEVVGRLLRQLGDKGQVICVTHLAQVASQGHQHLQVIKTASKKTAESTLVELVGDAKVEEIARMLGGIKVTEQSLAHAREMLGST
ncbi:DNA repair protein RecN [Cellvibrio japonicus]|uniref:DNA repair protein RecN n=1 Tax=Cellvibrio japonicus (strain Ueda107) TaxID=498211 RepID=B3PF37_CELJU|nr:DNA repair protein RecN [Cellvibrio japonicus]ACE82834.1 DNA repair protein RecN [Cellvibrio japonicus Ueda107]QEI13594.1 DNA repair protein RecN [Cellvibrio japonicus]QEI17168.1 DNA repair protein RecN [Cellvibrio japonicus]QEI20745.1 DNA repair protein RecN [Cellvibrio japonicus]